MSKGQVNAVVSGYLNNLEIPYGRSEDGDSYRVLAGSTAVYIDFYDAHNHTIVNFKAFVLGGINEDSPLGLLPMINAELSLGKFCFYPDDGLVTLEYELLGETMDEDEFHAAVQTLAYEADHWDDRLQTEYHFGGHRHQEDEDATEREV